MQNLTLQMAKAAPARQQMANQDNVANGTADSAVNGAPNPFAELLKKQVKQKEASGNGNRENVPANDTVATSAKAGTDAIADKTNVELRVSALDEKSKAEAQTETTPAPIQDVILMQMGLQPAAQMNPNQAAAVASGQAVDEAVATPDAAIQHSNAGIEKSTPITMGTQPTVNAADNKVNATGQSFAQQVGANMPNQSADMTDTSKVADDIVGKKELLQNPALAAESNGKELDSQMLDTKAMQAQINTAAIAQQASTKALDTTTAAAMAANEIPMPFGKPEWSQAVNQKVVWMVGKGEQSATLTLNPPDMGPLKVVIQVDNDHVDTTFISDNPEVRQALQDGMQMLRDKMQDTGMQLGNAQVNSQAQSQRQFEQAMQQRAQQRLEQSAKDAPDHVPVSPVMQRVSNGLVDTFA